MNPWFERHKCGTAACRLLVRLLRKCRALARPWWTFPRRRSTCSSTAPSSSSPTCARAPRAARAGTSTASTPTASSCSRASTRSSSATSGPRAGPAPAIVIPREVIHRYEHETTDQARFLNIHAPGMDFAEYLFGERRPRTRTTSSTRRRRGPSGERREHARLRRRGRGGHRPARADDPHPRRPARALSHVDALRRGRGGPRPAHPQGAPRRVLHPHRRAELRPRPGGRAGDRQAGHVRARAARRDPHVPQRRTGRRDLAQFPRTFQGFRELPPRSGLRLG